MRASALQNNHGFSLIEMMMVIAIISTLASIAIPNYMQYREKAYKVSCMSNLRYIEIEAKARYAESREFEPELIDIYTCPRQGDYVWMSTDPDSPEFAKVLCSIHYSGSEQTGEPPAGPDPTSTEQVDWLFGYVRQLDLSRIVNNKLIKVLEKVQNVKSDEQRIKRLNQFIKKVDNNKNSMSEEDSTLLKQKAQEIIDDLTG